MSTMIHPPAPISPPMAQSNTSSARRRTPRRKHRNLDTGTPQQPRTNHALNVNATEATSSKTAVVAPSVAVVAHSTMAKTTQAKKQWSSKRKTPKRAQSQENERGRMATTAEAATATADFKAAGKVAESHLSAEVSTALGHHESQADILQAEPKGNVEETLGEEDAKILRSQQRKAKKEKKRERKQAHLDLILSAAKTTIATLQEHSLPCAVFGSLACKLYGSARYPKDVDLLVLPPPSADPDSPILTAENIKTLILDTNPRHFYLKLPRDPEATYRILYYRLEYLGEECKVDILLPGTMHLPYIPPPSSHEHPTIGGGGSPNAPAPIPANASASSSTPLTTNVSSSSPRNHVKIVSGIPLVPFSLLLFHKLQGWDDHRNAPEVYKQRKQGQDAADVRRLLTMEENMKDMQQTLPCMDPILFSEEFQQLTRARVKEFCNAFPTRAHLWQSLGFDTGTEAPSPTGEGNVQVDVD